MTVELQTPSEWAWREGVEILDPDGWRRPHGKDFHEPLSHEEFLERLAISTVRYLRGLPTGRRWEG